MSWVPRRVVVTGAAGFIGSHFTRLLATRFPDARIVAVDKLTYAGNRDNLYDLESSGRIEFVEADICDERAMGSAIKGADALANFAAETHVDRSLMSAGSFVTTDVFGTYVLLEAVRNHGVQRFLHVSTDEVYGHVHDGRSVETDAPRPRSPYAASKVGAEMLCQAYHVSHGVPVVMTRGANTYGPNQFPEKIVPLFITNALDGRALPVYGDGSAVRDYLHVDDHCEAALRVLLDGVAGEAYNVGAGTQVSGLSVAEAVLALTGQSRDLLTFVQDRPGHDYRYAMDSSRVRSLGWEPAVPFSQGLERTVNWYREHRDWWQRLKGGEFEEFYRRNYRPLSAG
ncbi:MAG: dTDP-glucose 4,6-dehydratase [Candidatus Dormibacteria bacterium]